MVLGLIESLLFVDAIWFQQWPLDWTLFVAVSLFFYLFLPAVEGFLTVRQRGHASSAVSPGCLVGGIGFLILALAFAVAWHIMPPEDQISCPPGETCSPLSIGRAAFIGTAVIQTVAPVLLLLEGVAGAIGGLLGGWIGEVLGQKRAAQARPHGETAAGDTPSSGDSNHGAR
jgi:hypothetical protein